MTTTDPTFQTFANDADNPTLPPALALEVVAIPGASPDETGYKINPQHWCLLRLTKPVDAAASVYGYLAIAFAVHEDGTPILRPSGKTIEGTYTAALQKSLLLADPNGISQSLRTQAIDGAIRALLIELAVVAANDVAGV